MGTAPDGQSDDSYDAPVQSWLDNFKTLPEVELAGFAERCRGDQSLISGIIAIIQDSQTRQHITPICHQLFLFFRHPNSSLFCAQSHTRLFALELLPCVIHRYMIASQLRLQSVEVFDALESFLLGLYNVAVTREKQRGVEPRIFRVPSLGVSSIYHDSVVRPGHFQETAGAEADRLVYQEQFPHLANVNAESRFKMLRFLQRTYNNDLAFLNQHSLESFCKLYSSLVSQHHKPRIPLEAGYLQEVLVAVYFAMFNCEEGTVKLAEDCLLVIEKRANYDINCQVQLTVNAIRNSMISNPSGAPRDGPMGVRVSLSTLHKEDPMDEEGRSRKISITNASFKTKRLPEDIPVRLAAGRGAAQPIPEERVLPMDMETMGSDLHHIELEISNTSSSTLNNSNNSVGFLGVGKKKRGRSSASNGEQQHMSSVNEDSAITEL